MDDEPSDYGKTLKIIGGLVAGAAFLALFGAWYTTPKAADKARCRKVLKEDPPPPCLHISPGKRRHAEGEENIQQVSNTIPPSKPSEFVETAPPVTELVPSPPLREVTPPQRCAPELNQDGEPNKPFAKTKKPCVGQAPKPHEQRIYGCGERVPEVEPVPIYCKEVEEPAVVKVIERPKRKCDRGACVGIDPARRRWPELAREAATPKSHTPAPSRSADPHPQSGCAGECVPLNPSKRRYLQH